MGKNKTVTPATTAATIPGVSNKENKNSNESTKKAQGSKTAATAAIEEEAPLVQAETIETGIIKTKKGNSKEVTLMSPDGKVAFATLMQKRYIDNADAGIKYGQAFVDEIDNFIDNTVMLTLLDIRQEAIDRGVDVNLTFKNGNSIFVVTEACKMLGITLPAPKLLSDGQQTLNFKEAVVDENIQTAIENETAARKTIEEKIPELDPSKITSDEEIKAALEYVMRSDSNVLKSLVNTIEWLRNLRNFKATSADAKLLLENRTIGVWIEEILSIINPTLMLTGIGRAIYVNASQDKSPLSAHCTVRKNVLDADGKTILNETQIADVVMTLLKANAKFSLKNEPEEMKNSLLLSDKAIEALMSGNETEIETILKKEEARDKKLYSMVLKQYYPTPEGDMTDKMHQKLGQLLNLYLPISERMDAYPEILDTQEYPEVAPAVEEKKN